jgi:lysophospholipase L1-like esterase
MINGGGECRYPLGSQLAQAVQFLRHHDDALVTVDIAANDVFPCISRGGIDQHCVQAGSRAIKAQLPVILQKLRAAAGPSVPIVGMTYYDPFLGWWLTGKNGQSVARASLPVVGDLDNLIENIFSAAKDPVADVQGAFHTQDSALLPNLELPVDVQRICLLTYMCMAAPMGPNVHANLLGYGAIATAFARVIGRLGPAG